MLTLHYEARLGLARGAVYRDGLPHLYLEGPENDASPGLLATRSVARLRRIAGGMCFLQLADGAEAVMDTPQGTKMHEGAAVEVEITAEARLGKRAGTRFLNLAEGPPRRLSPVSCLKDRLRARARSAFGDAEMREEADREAILSAREAACAISGPLVGGGDLSIEATRGLIACDVDTAGEGGIQTPRTFARACNERAAADLPRRLRLSGLGGLVVVDLIGQRHDGEKLRRLLLDGFAAEAPQIIVGPIGRFGTLEFTRPWGASPVYDFTPMAIAIDLIWQALAMSEADRSRVIILSAQAAALDILRDSLTGSLDPLAPMLRLEDSKFMRAAYA